MERTTPIANSGEQLINHAVEDEVGERPLAGDALSRKIPQKRAIHSPSRTKGHVGQPPRMTNDGTCIEDPR